LGGFGTYRSDGFRRQLPPLLAGWAPDTIFGFLGLTFSENAYLGDFDRVGGKIFLS